MAKLERMAKDMIARQASFAMCELFGQHHRIAMCTVDPGVAPPTYLLTVDSSDYNRQMACQSMRDFGLSDREVSVCTLLVEGRPNRAIAEYLFISEATVKDHVASIFEKLGIKHRSAIAPRLLGF